MKKLGLSLFTFLFVFQLAYAQYGQYQSAYIYQFTNFIQWPASKSSGDFVIGVIGNADVKKHLDALSKSRKVGARKIVVKQFSSAAQASGCHMLFLASSSGGEFSAAKGKAKSMNALLVTEKDGLGAKGSGVNFVIVGGKLKFELNKASLKASGLSVNSKLEQLAIIVG